ncbi:hypothetical protein HMPREF9120_02554, partial [Neisseria sp. oral taxon 020 str. F0370]
SESEASTKLKTEIFARLRICPNAANVVQRVQTVFQTAFLSSQHTTAFGGAEIGGRLKPERFSDGLYAT